jgi:hypothetical protein
VSGEVQDFLGEPDTAPALELVLSGLTLAAFASAIRPRVRVALPPALARGAPWAGLAFFAVVWLARLAGRLPAPP